MLFMRGIKQNDNLKIEPGKWDQNHSNISQIETGKRSVGKNLAKRLAKIFNLDYRVFL